MVIKDKEFRMKKSVVDWSIMAACLSVILGVITIVGGADKWMDKIKDGCRKADAAYADVVDLKPRVLALEKDRDAVSAKIDEVRSDVKTLVRMHLSNSVDNQLMENYDQDRSHKITR